MTNKKLKIILIIIILFISLLLTLQTLIPISKAIATTPAPEYNFDNNPFNGYWENGYWIAGMEDRSYQPALNHYP